MELPIVVGVDGSDTAFHALDWAADMAHRRQLPLRIVHASIWERYEGHIPARAAAGPGGRVRSERVLAAAAERAGRRAPALRVMTDLAADDAVAALMRAGQSAAAVVVGSRGRGEFTSLVLGSVGLRVAARADCPVVVVRGRRDDPPGRTRRVTVGVAEREQRGGRPGPPDSAPVPAAVAFALREAQLRGCALEAVHAWRRTAAEAFEERDVRQDPVRRAGVLLDEALRGAASADPPVPVARRAVQASARKALLDASARSDLLVVGARRRDRHLGPRLGLVNHAMLHHAQCPVAVVPQICD
jgi:nucleotide-binding universal stress UspA family protein